MNQDEMRESLKAERDAMLDPDEPIIDEVTDTITLYGVRYSRKVFRTLGLGPIGTLLRMEKRDDGIVTLRTYEPGEQVTA